MRKVISNTCDWLGEILAEVSDDVVGAIIFPPGAGGQDFMP